MADKTITNAQGAWGYSTLDQQLWNTAFSAKASAAVTAGRVVALGTDGTVAHAATNGTASLQGGVAQTDIASGNDGLIVHRGYVSGFADGTIAAGDILKRSTTTAGYVMATATPVLGEQIGVALAASASSRVDMWVTR